MGSESESFESTKVHIRRKFGPMRVVSLVLLPLALLCSVVAETDEKVAAAQATPDGDVSTRACRPSTLRTNHPVREISELLFMNIASSSSQNHIYVPAMTCRRR